VNALCGLSRLSAPPSQDDDGDKITLDSQELLNKALGKLDHGVCRPSRFFWTLCERATESIQGVPGS